MKMRTLALALALGFALTASMEAKKRPVYNTRAQKARKANVARYKATKRKVSRAKVSRVKHK